MSRRLIIRRRAERDVAEALAWYGANQSGVEERFLTSLRKKLSDVTELPESFPLIHGNVRRALLANFPYAIFFCDHAIPRRCAGRAPHCA